MKIEQKLGHENGHGSTQLILTLTPETPMDEVFVLALRQSGWYAVDGGGPEA